MDSALRQRQSSSASSGNAPQFASAEEESKHQSFGWICVRLSSSALCGVVFGFGLEKGRVFEPQVIIDQMLFVRFVMLKMFLSASATSMFCFSMMSMLPVTHQYMSRAMQEFAACLRNKGVMSSVVGGAIMGTGMTLSGSCPGMVLVQAGAGAQNALVTLLGGVSGVVLYGLMEPYVVRATRPQSPIQQHFLHQHLGSPFFALAVPCVAVLGMMVFGVELYSPWTSEVVVKGDGILSSLSWPPYLAGIVVGLLQIPVVLLNYDTLGSSSSYCSVVSQAFRMPSLHRLCPYFSAYTSGAHNWWQVCFIFGAVAGGYLSSWMSGSQGQALGVNTMAMTFIGGACMLFGARLAAGCTSGHGLSGMGMLALLSLAAVPAMFAGGITAAILQKIL